MANPRVIIDTGRLRAARLAKRLTQQRLSEIIDADLSYIAHLESPARLQQIYSRRLHRITRALGVSPEALTGKTCAV